MAEFDKRTRMHVAVIRMASHNHHIASHAIDLTAFIPNASLVFFVRMNLISNRIIFIRKNGLNVDPASFDIELIFQRTEPMGSPRFASVINFRVNSHVVFLVFIMGRLYAI